MDFNELCRFCASNTSSQIQLFSQKDPNLQEIVGKFFPIKISEADNLPKCICKACFAQVMVVKQFFENIINTDKVLKHKQEQLKQQQANISKIISEKLKKLPISIKKVPAKQPVAITQTQLGDKNDNSKDIAVVLNKLTGVTVKKTKIIPSIKSPTQDLNSEVIFTRRRTAKHIIYDEELKDTTKDDSDEEYQPPTATTPRTTPKKKKLSASNGKSPSTKPIIKMVLNQGPAYVCVTCKSRFESFEQLKDHMTVSQKCKDANVTCQVCAKVCGNRKALYAHSLTHKEKITHTCEICSKAFVNRFNLENHKASAHAITVEENGNIYRCQTCEKHFNSRNELFLHREEHKKEKIERLCETCGKSFMSMDALRAHCRTHSNVGSFACNVEGCHKKFRSRVQLTQHSHVHTRIKSFPCQKCEKSYAKKSSLTLHEKNHTCETSHKCQVCGLCFMNSTKLKDHENTLHPQLSSDKPNSQKPGSTKTENNRTIEESVIIQPTSGQPSSYTLSFQNF